MIEPVPAKLTDEISKLLSPGEKIELQLKGAFKEALVCTNLKVAIIKSGFMTGHFFGTNVFQMPYKNIAGVEVTFHFMRGYFEISGGGMQNTAKDFWNNTSRADPKRAPNCISLSKRNVEKFRLASACILARSGSHSAMPDVKSPEDSLAALDALGKLRDKGVITEAEFAAKKKELLARI